MPREQGVGGRDGADRLRRVAREDFELDGPHARSGTTCARCGGGGRDPGVGFLVGEREHHTGEGDPVGDAMVEPKQQRAALAEAFDQVDVPERPGGIDWAA